MTRNGSGPAATAPGRGPGQGAGAEERRGAGRDRRGQRRVGRLVREVLLTGEEPHEGPPLVRGLVADRAAQVRITLLECVEHRPLGDLTGDVDLDLAVDLGDVAQVCRKDDSDHGSVCTSTDSTAGRSRTIGAQLSPESADP